MLTSISELRKNKDFQKSLFNAWDGFNEKQSRGSDFASSNKDINDIKALLNSVTVKQLFRIQLSKKHGYQFYYFNGLQSLLNEGIQFIHSDYTVNLLQVKQYIKVTIIKDEKQLTVFNLSENGLKQFKALDLNKGLYSVIWDLLQRYQSRMQGLK